MAGQAPSAGGAQLSIRIGEAVEFDARISAVALLAVGALVSGVLLASSVVVLAATNRTAARAPGILLKDSNTLRPGS